MLSKVKSAFGGKKKIILSLVITSVLLAASRFKAIPTMAEDGVEPDVPVCGESHTDGLVSYWKADGDATDSYDGNHGTLENGATANGIGMVGQAFSLDGVNDYVSIPDSPDFAFVTSDFAIEAWVNLPSISLVRPIIHTNHSSNYIGLYAHYPYTYGGPFVSINAAPMFSAPPLLAGTWNHIAVVGSAGTAYLYVNGELENSAAFSHTFDSTGYRIGAELWNNHLNGLIDEVAVYNTALTGEEVYQHFINGLNGEEYCTQSKADFLRDSGIPGKGLENAPGLQKPFNYKSQAGENAGKK